MLLFFCSVQIPDSSNEKSIWKHFVVSKNVIRWSWKMENWRKRKFWGKRKWLRSSLIWHEPNWHLSSIYAKLKELIWNYETDFGCFALCSVSIRFFLDQPNHVCRKKWLQKSDTVYDEDFGGNILICLKAKSETNCEQHNKDKNYTLDSSVNC